MTSKVYFENFFYPDLSLKLTQTYVNPERFRRKKKKRRDFKIEKKLKKKKKGISPFYKLYGSFQFFQFWLYFRKILEFRALF